MNLNQIEIPREVFFFFFKPFIRVLFSWERMERERWPIRLLIVDDLATLSSWYMPWNFDEKGKEVDYQLPNARPIQARDIPNLLSALDSERQHLIFELARSFRVSEQPIQVIVPTYSLGNGQSFLLDGNHRVAALMVARVPFKLMSFTVCGPLDREIIPELRHWE